MGITIPLLECKKFSFVCFLISFSNLLTVERRTFLQNYLARKKNIGSVSR